MIMPAFFEKILSIEPWGTETGLCKFCLQHSQVSAVRYGHISGFQPMACVSKWCLRLTGMAHRNGFHLILCVLFSPSPSMGTLEITCSRWWRLHSWITAWRRDFCQSGTPVMGFLWVINSLLLMLEILYLFLFLTAARITLTSTPAAGAHSQLPTDSSPVGFIGSSSLAGPELNLFLLPHPKWISLSPCHVCNPPTYLEVSLEPP